MADLTVHNIRPKLDERLRRLAELQGRALTHEDLAQETAPQTNAALVAASAQRAHLALPLDNACKHVVLLCFRSVQGAQFYMDVAAAGMGSHNAHAQRLVQA